MTWRRSGLKLLERAGGKLAEGAWRVCRAEDDLKSGDVAEETADLQFSASAVYILCPVRFSPLCF